MHNFQASLVTNLAIVATISACVLGIGFMLRFLLALTTERKTSLAGFRLEYRVNSSLPNGETGQVRPRFAAQSSPSPANSGERAYDPGKSFSGTPQALKEAALTREYRFTDSSWQEPNRV
jgi:hypothetical protein